MKKIKVFFMSLFLSLVFSITAFADADVEWGSSALLPEGVKQDIDRTNVGRGRYLSSAGLTIINKGYGEIGIYADTLCHVPVKKIRMNVYLDRWDEDKEDWIQVDYYSFTAEYKEGGEDITSITESFSVLGLPTGIYYRLRSANVVYAFDGTMEVQGPKTDGILITDGPVY